MVSLFALYRKPDNESAFLQHYETIHAPLARQMPGILSLEWGRQELLFSPEADPWFLVAEMRFSTRDAMMAALNSPQGRAAGADLNGFARGLVIMRMVEWHD